MKYAYPAVFTKENNGQYSVDFPDFEGTNYGCATGGNDINHAIDMAGDALCLILYHLEQAGDAAPKVSNPKTIKIGENEFVSLVACDTEDYKRFYDSKAVKKTLTIPSWLNSKAEKKGVNFSQVLQDALRQQLNL
jgi:predicted RNase H-like HicB family nuclease